MTKLRIGIRLLALAAWLLVCVIGYYACLAPRSRRRWPPRFFGGSLRIVGVELSQIGMPAPAPRLLLPNHLSWLDIIVLGAATGTVFVARDSLAEQPQLRWLSGLNRTVFIARDDRLRVAGQVGQLREALAANPVMTLFAEGGTGDGRELRPFHSSLLAAIERPPPGLSIQPVWIDYGADAPDIAWFGNEPGRANFLRVLSRRSVLRAEVHLLTPLTIDECASRKTMALAARQRIMNAIGG
jgi:1-acyl-sn-glycerol-3-phosphate acyltransferase